MNFVVAPDSFKGSLKAEQAADIMRRAILSVSPEAVVHCLPMADGGEGTMDALLSSTGGTRISILAENVEHQACPVSYGILGDGQTAVIEIAQIVGLNSVEDADRAPLRYTTYGVGSVLRQVLEAGFRKVVIGLGGSATNDGGFGLLQGLGAVFTDSVGTPLPPFPPHLKDVHAADLSGLPKALAETELWLASDVNNPLCGIEGCSHVFGPQKGASAEDIAFLDEALAHYANVTEQAFHGTWKHAPGAGAAGGLGFALLALGAKFRSGAELVAEYSGLNEAMKNADYVITGEGRTDAQTLRGKLPYFVGQQAKKLGIPCLLISGSIADGAEALYDTFVSMHSTVQHPMAQEDAMANAEPRLFLAVQNAVRLIRVASARPIGAGAVRLTQTE